MPQADLRYSADLTLDVPALLAALEATIARHDSGAGACKGRAYPADTFHHTHLYLEIRVLEKPHRTPDFMAALLADLHATTAAHLDQPCELAVSLGFAPAHYTTGRHTPT